MLVGAVRLRGRARARGGVGCSCTWNGGAFLLVQLCRFGIATVEGVRANAPDGGTIVCRAPSMLQAGALAMEPVLVAHLTFAPDELVWQIQETRPSYRIYELHGHATIVSGVLQLTHDAPGQVGSCVLARPIGADGSPTPTSALLATFDVQIGGSCGDDGIAMACGGGGVSFSFGDVPDESFGVHGAGDGLRIQLHTRAGRRELIAAYAGQMLVMVPMDEDMRAHALQQMEVRVLSTGLWVRHGSRMLVRGVPIPQWAPRLSWRAAFGAETGGDDGDHDRHLVDNIVVQLGALSTPSGRVPLEVSLNGGQFSTDGLSYTYVSAAHAHSIYPASGPRAGGTNVSIRATNLQGGDDYRCNFNGTVVHASLALDGTALRCTSPEVNGAAKGEVTVAVTLNGQDYTVDPLGFAYYDLSMVQAVYPHSGPSRGGTIVSVGGAGLLGGSQPRCRFTGAINDASLEVVTATTSASVENEQHLLCHAPALHPLRSTVLEIALNAQQYTQDSHAFAVHAPTEVLGLSPDRGPVDGETRVLLMGRYFDGGTISEYACRFGEVAISATLVNDSTLACISGNLSLGTHCLEATLNGQDFTDDCVVFTALPTSNLSSHIPTSGPVDGDSRVLLLGRHLIEGSDYRCRFAPSAVATNITGAEAATLIVESTLQADGAGVVCSSPKGGLLPLSYDLSVSINGQQYTGPVRFEAFAAPTVQSISPSAGPVQGGTIVVLAGQHFSHGSDYRCTFGEVHVLAFAVSDALVNCTSPPTSIKGPQTLRLTMNGQQYVSAPNFAYHEAPVLRVAGLSPSSGPSTGNTTVTVSVTANASLAGGSHYLCSFGHAGRRVHATYSYGTGALTCVSPSSEWRASQPFTVSLNGQQYVKSEASFMFTGEPQISLPSPMSGPQHGSTLVTFTGRDLINGSHYVCLCEGLVVPASVGGMSTQDVVRCRTPPSARQCDSFGRCAARYGNTTCAVSLNGQQYTNEVGFVYHETPHVSASTPACGPVRGGTTVQVHGIGFRNGTDYVCAFGDARVSAIANFSDGAETLQCSLPSGLSAGSMLPLSVAINGQQFSVDPESFFSVFAAPALTSLYPVIGPSHGGTQVTIEATNVSFGCDYWCAVDDVVIPCDRDNADEGHVQLEMPASPSWNLSTRDETPAQVQVRVSLNGQQYTDSLPYIRYHGALIISSVSPSSGPALGGNVVRLQGLNFHNTSRLRCLFGDVRVLPTFYNSTDIECVSPQSADVQPDVIVPLLDNAHSPIDIECYEDLLAADYRGYIATTRQGYTCQGWSVQFPHSHSFTARAYPHAHLGVHNFCRNPNASDHNGAWCFTTSPHVRWERCDVGLPNAKCTSRLVLVGGASLQDGSLRLTDNENQFGKASFPVRNLTPREQAGDALAGFRLDFDVLIGVASQRQLQERMRIFRPSSTFSVRYGPHDGESAGLELRMLTRDAHGQLARPHLEVFIDGRELHHVQMSSLHSDAFVPMWVQLTIDHKLRIEYDGIVLLHDLELADHLDFHPTGDWAVGFEARTGWAEYDVHMVSNVRLSQLGWNPFVPVAVEATLNLQEFSRSAVSFEYTVAALVSSCSPASGPAQGGTLVVVRGTGFGSAQDLSCRFGDIDVPGRLLHDDRITCHTPDTERGFHRSQLQVTKRGHQHTGASLSFTFYDPVRVSWLSVVRGPTAGGTTITVHGANLVEGSVDCRCRFGSELPYVFGTKSAIPGEDAVLCTTPAHMPGDLSLELAANAQDYSNDNVSFVFYEPPVILGLSPASGPADGSSVILQLSNASLSLNTGVECRFGAKRVPGTVTSNNGALRCVAPSGANAAAESVLELPFGRDTHVDSSSTETVYSIHGSARLLDDGMLGLTSNDYHLNGYICLKPTHLAALVATSFHFSFDVYVGDGSGGDGFSVCYGDAQYESVGAQGLQSGLCVRFLTRDALSLPHEVIQVVYNGVVLRSTEVRTSGSLTTSLRLKTLVPVQVAYSSAGLRVGYHTATIFDGIFLPDWRPQPTWQFCLGASTSQWRDAHRVSNVRLQVGALVDSSSVAVEITANGEQFSTSGTRFAYYPSPTVSWVLPSTGPIEGGTLVVLAADGLFPVEEHVRCRFNDTTVPASYAEHVSMALIMPRVEAFAPKAGVVLCRSPRRSNATTEHVSLSLNAQDYTTASAAYRTYPPPRVYSLDPPRGPRDGGTRVVVHGADLLAGDNSTRFCAFGTLPLVAAWVLTETTALCIAPPSLGLELTVSVELTLNAQDFSSDGVNFTFDSPVTVLLATPASGPSNGMTLVTLNGLFDTIESEYICSFGPAKHLVPATRTANDTLLCRSPALAPATYQILVTPDGIHFTSAGPSFTVHPLPVLLRISPESGPLSGGTLVTLTGRGFGALGPHLCIFGATNSTAVSATLHDDSELFCTSPSGTYGAATMRISMNGQQYLYSSLEFNFYRVPLAARLSPSTGPVQGGTFVVIYGDYMHGGSDRLCQFSLNTAPVPLVALPESENASVCVTLPVDATQSRSLSLTLNGQQYVDSGLMFHFMQEASISAMSPAAGPIHGQMLISIDGLAFDGGDDLRCRFGTPVYAPFPATASIVPATFDQLTQQLSCFTTPSAAGPLPLEISLNGQQFSATLSTLHVYDPPHVSALSPSSGPIGSTTSFRVLGSFYDGIRYQCRFHMLGLTVNASLLDAIAADTLVCETPLHVHAHVTTVEVALNGQQFTVDGVSFTFYEAQHINALSPTCGPVAGATALVVSGQGFFPTTELRCRFHAIRAEYTVPAFFISPTHVGCSSPMIGERAPAIELLDSEVNRTAAVYGSASFLESRMLSVALNQLTHFTIGTLALDVHKAANFVVRSFELRFNMTIISGPSQDDSLSMGDGLSFSYGDVAQDVVSERGAGLGLRIQFRQFGSQSLHIIHIGRELHSSNLTLVRDKSTPVLLKVHNTELTIRIGDSDLASHVLLPNWQPRKTWRMALGARTGRSSARHELYALSLLASPYYDFRGVGVEVSSNTNVFTSDGVKLSMIQKPSFTPPHPTTGSNLGGSPVVFHGSLLRGACHPIVDYNGSSVNATYQFVDQDTLLTVTPAQPQVGTIPVRITLNGQQYDDAHVFGFFDEPYIQLFSPTSGPTEGGTRIVLDGGLFTGGSAPFCRFGSALVDAHVGDDHARKLLCRLPGSLAPGIYPLEATLNGQVSMLDGD